MLKRLTLAILACTGFGGMAHAADMAPPPSSPPDWVFTFAPYVWMSGINGKIGVDPLPAQNVDVSFGDILKHLDLAFMGFGEARNGRFSIGTDIVWAKLSDGQQTPHGVLADKLDLSTSMLMLTGFGGYSLIYEDNANLDAVAGARLWSLSSGLDFKGGIADGTSVDGSQTWVDPVVGFKGRAKLGDKFYVTGWGLVGGFGVSSKFMWDAFGGLGYEFNDTFSVVAGYRAVGDDYRKNGIVYDTVQKGPIIGGVIKF